MSKELLVVLNKKDSGFGISLLGQAGLPPIIYNILEDSPAAESGEVEVGDVILKVNETDVNRFTTKEVLKCLRLSQDPVTLKIKRDPKIKASVQKHIQSVSGSEPTSTTPLVQSSSSSSVSSTTSNNSNKSHHLVSHIPISNRNRSGVGGGVGGPAAVHHAPRTTSKTTTTTINNSSTTTNGSCATNNIEQEPLLLHNNENERLHWEPLAANNDNTTSNKIKGGCATSGGGQPKFEAYMMTGEHILNISRMPQTATTIIPKQQKKVDSLRYHNSHTHHLRHQHNSVPNSPNEMDLGYKNHHCKSVSNSANTSPVSANKWGDTQQHNAGDVSSPGSGGGGGGSGCGGSSVTIAADPSTIRSTATSKQYSNFVRTSRSEDQLQGQNDSCGMSAVNIDVDEDITSSLNTLLDTRPENLSGGSDKIVWTYNAPISDHHNKFCHTLSNGSSSSHTTTNTNSSPTPSSPSHSPASPTSVSSSVMSSHSGSRHLPYYHCAAAAAAAATNNNNYGQHQLPTNGAGGGGGGVGCSGMGGSTTCGDYSVSEAISNISSPDYKDDDSMGIKDCVMEISDHSDSDSTLLVSEPRQRHNNSSNSRDRTSDGDINLKKGSCCDTYNVKSRSDSIGHQISNDYQDTNYDIDEDIGKHFVKSPSPQSSEDESDVESLHSFHYSPKAVDLPSAIRLAKRLYCLDGFKKSDVSRHLSKNNDFSRAVAEEYLKYFNFEVDTLDTALRKFLKQFSLTGETQERERVLVHFSKRYLDCNPGSFNSQDAVHTLTCAIMLLNTDLHGQNMNRKMSCNEFIENLAGLNESENFPREILKQLYHAIKNHPLEWALDEENEDSGIQMQNKNNDQLCLSGNPFLDIPISSNAVEYKKGYVMRKCCYEANAKRTPFHKRSWKMFYCTLRDLVLYLHKDENGFRKNQMGDNFHNAIRIHHALATKACDYTKKQYVFRLQTADQAEYLFQTSDSKELQSWIDTINFVCASFSAPPLEAAVGSQKKFQRPLLPCSHTKLNLREQLRDHEERVFRLEADLEEHRKCPPEKGSKSLIVQNYREKEAYLTYEVKRYRTYSYMLRSRMSQYPELGISLVENSIGEVDEATGVTLMEGPSSGIVPPPIPDRPSPPTNRRGPE